MYICICNAIKESRVRQAIREGAPTPDEIYEHCDTEMDCGKCEQHMLEIITEMRQKIEPDLPLPEPDEGSDQS